MIAVNYPEPLFQIKKEGGRQYLFDPIRKIWVVVTEEEWVRQNFVQYLVKELQYPAGLIALEKEIALFERKKRFDVLVHDPHHRPWMMIECKAPQVALNDAVLEQLLRYHMSVPVPFLVVTNGAQTYAWEKKDEGLHLLQALPIWHS